MEKDFDVIIIGGGAAGLSAAIYSTRYNLNTLVVSSDWGGQILKTGEIENYPGFDHIDGPTLSLKYKKHAEKLGAKLTTAYVKSIKIQDTINKDTNFVVETEREKYRAKAVILTAGANHKKLKIPGEEEFAGRGVSYCATCDGPFFKNKVVAVVGGGDAAVNGAKDLANHASKVYLIHRRDKFRAKPGYVDQVKKNPKIEFILSTNVVRAKGDGILKSIELDNGKQLRVDGLFVEIGFKPESKLANGLGVESDEKGYIKVKEDQSTNVKGVFAAGDLTTASNRFAQLTTAVSEGSIAAQGAYHYLQNSKKDN